MKKQFKPNKFSALALLILLFAPAFGTGMQRRSPTKPAPAAPSATKAIVFTDVTAAAKINWVCENLATPEKYFIETMGGGGAFLDYDQDGWLDIYLVNAGATPYHKPKTPIRNALYRNNGDGTFADVTEKARVGGGGYGQGVAVGDINKIG